MRTSLAVLACALSLQMPGATAQELPAAVRQSTAGWVSPGRAEMRWFGVRLYSAELWAERVSVAALQKGGFADHPFALRLIYARKFGSELLVDSSMEEIRRLGVTDEALLARWRVELARVLPAVKEGEMLTGLHVPGQGARFHHGEKFMGEIADPELARRFFAIWLDPRTREPVLRSEMLGLPK